MKPTAVLIIVVIAATAPAQNRRARTGIGSYRDASIQVHVVDSKGSPLAGVPVAAVFPLGNRLVASVLGTDYRLSASGIPPLDVVGVTDSEGNYTLQIARAGLPLGMLATAVGARKMSVEVCVRAPFAKGIKKRFTMGNLPKQPVVLTCPPFTKVSVQCTTKDGRPDPRPCIISIATLQGLPDPGTSHRYGLHAVTVTGNRGAAAFPFVGAGQRLWLIARIEGAETRFTEVEITDDVTSLKPVAINLGPDATGSDTRLNVRLLRPNGEPLSAAPVSLTIETTSALTLPRADARTSPQRFEETTDKIGRVSLRLPAGAKPDPWVQTRIRFVSVSDSPKQGHLEAICVLPRGLNWGEDNLGDVALQNPPVVIRGMVAAEDGSAVEGATLQVEESRANVLGVPIPNWSASASRMAFDIWSPVDGLRAMSTKDGTFTIRGLRPAGRIRVVASRDGFLQAAPAAIKEKVDDVEMLMIRGCQLKGRVILDEGIPSEAVSVILTGDFDRDIRPAPSAPQWSAEAIFEMIATGVATTVDTGGTFHFDAIPPGTADIAIRVSNIQVFEHKGIKLRRGDLAAPSELSAIDLRGKLQLRQIKVTDSSGTPIEGAHAVFWDNEMKQGPVRAPTNAKGIAEIVTVGADPVRIMIWGPEGEPWKGMDLKDVGTSASTRLERHKAIRVILKNAEALPRPPYFLACVFDPVGVKQGRPSAFGKSEQGAHFDGTAIGTTSVEKPGRYEVKVMLWAIMPDLGFDVPVEFTGPKVVELKNDGSDVVEIAVDAASITRAINKVSGIVFQ